MLVASLSLVLSVLPLVERNHHGQRVYTGYKVGEGREKKKKKKKKKSIRDRDEYLSHVPRIGDGSRCWNVKTSEWRLASSCANSNSVAGSYLRPGQPLSSINVNQRGVENSMVTVEVEFFFFFRFRSGVGNLLKRCFKRS